MIGHNEITVRLGILANDAKVALNRVAKGETDAIDGWLAYGAALNEGRKLFGEDDDYNFGKWKQENVYNNLLESFVIPNAPEESAAMWAAANPDQFAEARAAGNARTVRGIHAKWNEINAEKAAQAAREAAEKARTVRTNLALKLESVIAARAKANLSLGGQIGAEVTNQGCQNSDKAVIPVDTKKEIAKIAGVSHDTAPSCCTIGVAICSRLVRRFDLKPGKPGIERVRICAT